MINAPLWAIVGACNEEDIVFATVANAFAQGAERVLIVDNGSIDDTLVEALKAGAEIAHTFETDSPDDLQRIRIMNDLVQHASDSSEHDAIWWLWLDCDEFPCGPSGKRLSDVLSELPEAHRVVGAQQINHFPRPWPQYQRGFHPWDFMPDCEELDTKALPTTYCPHRHWKHPLLKYVRGRPPIRAKIGVHTAYCDEPLSEPAEAIELHHFPYRARDNTYDRYKRLCRDGDTRRVDHDLTSPERKSALTQQFEMLDHVYSGRWDQICINPTPREFGARRWYPAESAPDVAQFEDMPMSVLVAGDDRTAYPGLLLASVLADLGASVRLVCDSPDAIEGSRALTGTAGLPVVVPGRGTQASLLFIATDAPWVAWEINKSDAQNIVVLSGGDVAPGIDPKSLNALDAGLLPLARRFPGLRNWEHREDLVLVNAGLQSPECCRLLSDLMRPELGGVTLGLVEGVQDCAEDDLLSLIAKAEKVGMRLSDLSNASASGLAEAMIKAKLLLATGPAQIARDAVSIGLPATRFDVPKAPVMVPAVADQLASLIFAALRSQADASAQATDFAASVEPRAATDAIGTELSAILARNVDHALADTDPAPVAEKSQTSVIYVVDETAARSSDVEKLKDDLQQLYKDVLQFQDAQSHAKELKLLEKLRKLRRQRTILLVPVILLTLPVSLPIILIVALVRWQKKRRSPAS